MKFEYQASQNITISIVDVLVFGFTNVYKNCRTWSSV